MTPQELKNSILQLAIQGRLVEQLDSDTPVDLSAYKRKKTDDPEFEIPDKWQIAHLESVTDAIPSKQYQILESQVLKEGLYPVISQSKEYSIGYSNETTKLFHHNESVIVFGDHTTEIKLVNFDFVVGADGVKIFAPKKCLTPSFFFYVMQYLCIDLSKVGGYSRHYKYIKNKPILIPPLAEQIRIVAKIEELLPLIDRYEQAWTKLETFNKRFPDDMQKSVLQMAIQGRLVEQRPEEGTGEELYRQIQAEKQSLIKEAKIKKEKSLPEITDEEIPFDIPDTWKWVRLGEIILSVADGPHFSPQYQDSGVPFISTRNVADGVLDFTSAKYISQDLHRELCKRCKPKKGDVLYTKGGTTGVAVVNDSDIEFNVWVHVAVLSLGSYIYPYYLAMTLNSPHCYELSQKYTHGTSNRDLGLTRMIKITLPLPPLAEQKRIVQKLEEILPLCKKLK